jgi:8-oxo-dGTP pyrophosphatase MutT (NUDIX family)
MNESCFYRVSVKGLVVDKTGRVLLARESSGVWDILGGGLDHDEDPRACLAREIQEETGLAVASVSDAPTHFLTTKNSARNTYIANVVYEITLANLDFTPSDECQELRFVSLKEMASLPLIANVQKLLEILAAK